MWRWCFLLAVLTEVSVSRSLRYRIPGFYSSHHCNLASQPSAAVGGVCNGTHETICKLHILSHGSEPDGAELGLTLQDLARGIEVVSCMGLEQARRHSHDRSRQRTGQIHLHPPFHLSWLWLTTRTARSRQQKQHFVTTFKTTTCQPPQSVPYLM